MRRSVQDCAPCGRGERSHVFSAAPAFLTATAWGPDERLTTIERCARASRVRLPR